MNLNSKLILASKNVYTGVNLYSFVLTYPRCILAEVNTHRMLSRNTASSRAIPIKKQRENIRVNPFIPISIGANQKGMQAGEELSGWRRSAIEGIIRALRYPNLAGVWAMEKLGAHKQVCNRYLEPWMWVQQLVTATDLKNVFKLRNNGEAEPHFHELAKQMQAQAELAENMFAELQLRGLTHYSASDDAPLIQILERGEWHLPFITLEEHVSMTLEEQKQCSCARAARVSYYLPESGARTNKKRDLELYARLSTSGHWSPFEHQATPVSDLVYVGNFLSWKQFRKEFEGEDGGDRALFALRASQ
jgi:hypothetical protein